jgi:hypothetical protein
MQALRYRIGCAKFRKMEAAMKVRGLILGIAIVFVSAMISENTFAWKDKSKVDQTTTREANKYRV